MGERLYSFWLRFRHRFRSRTRDASPRAYDYLRGQLTMDTNRNFANIDRTLNAGDGQSLQHFMSYSPWSAQAVLEQVQAELVAEGLPFEGSTLVLDESADEKAGNDNAGASRQYNGRVGKVDLCRVDTCLNYYHAGARLWTMVDGELFLPQEWFGKDFAQRRRKLGIPKERQFETKPQLGAKMVKRAIANGLAFELLAADSLYGQDASLRQELDSLGVMYAAQVPGNSRVYLEEPKVGVPPKRGKRGKKPSRLVVLTDAKPYEVRELAQSPQTQWESVAVRHSERGVLEAEFAVMRVWTVAKGKRPRAEWLVIRRQSDGNRYTLLNAPLDTPKETLIEYSCRRYFTERVFEDAKTQIGWDEFCAQKYLAWEHQLALTALALWFMAQTKLDWSRRFGRDPELMRQFEVEVLPTLSTANVRELMKAVMPLPQLTAEQATQLVVKHLVNRTRSTASRLKSQGQPFDTS